MKFGWDKLHESKHALRRRLASLPFAEKLRILDAMRERAVAIRSALTQPSTRLREERNSNSARE